MANSTTAQQTRDRVLQLAREIEELSHASVPPKTFFQQFLDLLVRALGAQAGAVWSFSGGRMNLIAELGLSETGLKDNPQAPALNQKLLSDVMANGQACTHAPDDADARLPSSHLIILAALHTNKECVGVVEVFQRPDSPAEARPGYLQFVEQMTGYASRYLDRQREGGTSPSDTAKFWDDFEQLVLQLQRSSGVDEVTATCVNDGRLLLGCDRMSVAVKRGKKTSIQAVSGEDRVNPRSNLIRAMAKLSERTMAMREPVYYTGKVDQLAPQIEEPLANFIQESGSRMVFAIPLFESEPLVESDEKTEHRKKVEDQRKAIGCLMVEQVSESRPKPELRDRVDLLTDHIGAALHNAQSQQRIFLLSFWKFLGGCREWFHGRKLAKTMAVLGGVAAIIAAMTFVRWEYRVEGIGRLMPVTQRQVFSFVDGEVVKIYVKGGDRVEKGQVLVELENDQLSLEVSTAQNQLLEQDQTLLALQAERDDLQTIGGNREDRIRVAGRIKQTLLEIEGLEEQLRIFIERKAKLLVRSPIGGVVATFQVEQLLLNRPIHRGEILLEVMDDTGDWRLEMEVEEHRMGHLLRAQKQQNEHLLVEFILATKTEATYNGKLQLVGTRSEKSDELGSVVEVHADIDANSLPKQNRRIGAEVRAKISCGQRSLGYVLFGDVVEFVRQRLWL